MPVAVMVITMLTQIWWYTMFTMIDLCVFIKKKFKFRSTHMSRRGNPKVPTNRSKGPRHEHCSVLARVAGVTMSSIIDKDSARKEAERSVSRKEAERSRKADLEVRIRKRVSCEEKAHHIVERMVTENRVTEDFLIDACKFIEASHYEDIVEERFIVMMCGYPVCGNKLTKVPKQKYHISRQTNKVYDITERKKFCSAACFKSSGAYQAKIPTSAVWMRENEMIKPVSLIPHTNNVRGGCGAEVLIDPSDHIRRELETLDHHDKKATRTETTPQTNKPQTKKVATKEQEKDKNKEAAPGGEQNTPQQTCSKTKEQIKEEEENITLTPDQMEKIKRLELLLDRREELLQTLTETPKQNNKEVPLKTPEEKQSTEAGKQSMETNTKPKAVDNLRADIYPTENLRTESCSVQTKGSPSQTQPPSNNTKTETTNSSLLKNNDFLSGVHEKNLSTLSGKSKLVPSARAANRSSGISSQDVRRNIQRAQKQRGVLQESILDSMRIILDQWITKETISFLQQDGGDTQQDGGDTQQDGGDTQKDEQRHTVTDLDKKMAEIGRRVSSLDVCGIVGEVEDLDEDDRRPKKMLPHYKALKEETTDFDLKVKEFYFTKTEDKEDESKNTSTITLPYVDSLQQMALRRNLVWERLQKVLCDVLGNLHVSVTEVATQLKALVSTFKFSSENISLKPAEWTIMAYLLVKLLGRKEGWLEERLLHQPPSVYFTSMMGSLGMTDAAVQKMILNILQQQTCNKQSTGSTDKRKEEHKEDRTKTEQGDRHKEEEEEQD